MSTLEASQTTSLPELPYSLHTRKRSIAIQWGILLLPTCVLTLILYYAIKYGSHDAEDIGKSTFMLGAKRSPYLT